VPHGRPKNEILPASGDQLGLKLSMEVSCAAPVPSEFITPTRASQVGLQLGFVFSV
jgi:hypothetical protein